ncbi:MAG TPA: hypothetical protein VG055_04555 [Planctomycetaceae bacterium]|jgi:hypothetical protein|nr:hypothetical protein [Planctomycetaceae bacterium]
MLDRATEHQKISDDRHERSWRAVEESQKVRETCIKIEAVERAQRSVGYPTRIVHTDEEAAVENCVSGIFSRSSQDLPREPTVERKAD